MFVCLFDGVDSEGRLRTKLYDKRDDFNFPIVNFPFICSNIPAAPAYGVYLSQLIRYFKACGSYICNWMSSDNVYDKWNISVVIYDTDIP
jgi:hypothetical protein